MPRPFTIYCLSEAQTPITHAEGVEGNEAVFKRIACYQDGRKSLVPTLTGNSLRSVMLRRPGMEWLIETAGLAERLTRPEAYFLLAGGAEYEGGGRESMQVVADLADCCPLAGVLGGCTPGQIFSGSVCVDFGVLVCRENQSRLRTFLPPGVDLPDRLRPAAEWMGRHQYYRHDHAGSVSGLFDADSDHQARAAAFGEWEGKGKPTVVAETPLKGERRDGKSASMPFAGESIIPGAMFAHRITLIHPNRLEAGAVLFSLRLWAAAGARVGGMTARGHGLLGPLFHFDAQYQGADEEYAAHVGPRAHRIADWLAAAFRAKKPKKEKAKP